MRRWFCYFLLFLGCVTGFGDDRSEPPMVSVLNPNITSQNVLISWADGIQKMVVWAEFENYGKEIVWLIPVPTKPTLMTTADPLIFHALHHQTAPEVEWRFIYDYLPILSFMAIGVIVYAFLRYKKSGTKSFLLFAIVWGMIALGMIVPVLFGSKELPVAVYDDFDLPEFDEKATNSFAVVTADTATGINAWLIDHGRMTLTDNEFSVVDKYCQNGWSWCAVTIKRSDVGKNAPAPIRIDFAATELIYPVAPNLISNEFFPVDLFVVHETQATEISEFEMVFVDRFKKGPRKRNGADCLVYTTDDFSRRNERQLDGELFSEFAGDQLVLSHSKLNGANSPISDDLNIKLKKSGPKRGSLIPQGQVNKWLIFIALWTLAVGSLVVGLLHQGRTSIKPTYLCLLIVTPIVTTSVSNGWFRAKIGGQFYPSVYKFRTERKLIDLLSGLMIDGQDAGKSRDQIFELLKDNPHLVNELILKVFPAKLEKTPGNYWLEKVGKRSLRFEVYFADGGCYSEVFRFSNGLNE